MSHNYGICLVETGVCELVTCEHPEYLFAVTIFYYSYSVFEGMLANVKMVITATLLALIFHIVVSISIIITYTCNTVFLKLR